MCDCNYDHLLLIDDECNVVGESGQIDTPIACRTQPPQQRVLNYCGARAFDLGTKTDAETRSASLVVAGHAFDLRGRLRGETPARNSSLGCNLPKSGKDLSR